MRMGEHPWRGGAAALELERSGSWNPSVGSGEEPDFYTDL